MARHGSMAAIRVCHDSDAANAPITKAGRANGSPSRTGSATTSAAK
jgi:hypothetical protein